MSRIRGPPPVQLAFEDPFWPGQFAAPYQVQAHIVDSDGKTDAVNHDPPIELSTGAQTLQMTFNGTDIYASGQSGPYRVKDVMISSNPRSSAQVLEASVPDMGQTQPYDYKTFQH